MKAASGPDALPDQEEELEDVKSSAVLSAEFAESDYAGHEPHQLPASSVSQSSYDGDCCGLMSTWQVFDPVEPLLDYIFEVRV